MSESAARRLEPSLDTSDVGDGHAERAAVAGAYRRVRLDTMALAAPLSVEDMLVQSMDDASPTKWHLAHTSWFFETFLLKPHARDHAPFDPAYEYLYNSYYNGIGEQYPRPKRGLISRPGLEEIERYRAHVDAAMLSLIEAASIKTWREIAPLIELGLNHEQQHQELIVTDIKHAMAQNPCAPAAYPAAEMRAAGEAVPLTWHGFEGGLVELGTDGSDGFVYDNETPRHKSFLEPFELASRPVTNGEFLAFVEDGGYRAPAYWLSDGWATVEREGWEAPLYWRRDGNWGWSEFTLAGLQPLDPACPATHLSLYEAAAFAEWSGARLPLEAELELAMRSAPMTGTFLNAEAVGAGLSSPHPQPAQAPGLAQLYGEVWEWTRSAYGPYPGFKPAAGAVGEYNGKFMCDQTVLRGGSCATPDGHVRPTYRNFFPSSARWQFSGVRLARSA